MTIGILGGGQLGYMLALAGYPLGLHFRFFDPSPEAPVGRIASRVTADFRDESALEKFANGLELVTYEFENVPVEAVRFLAERVPVLPVCRERWKSPRTASAKKRLFQELGNSDDGVRTSNRPRRSRRRREKNRPARDSENVPHGLRRQRPVAPAHSRRRAQRQSPSCPSSPPAQDPKSATHARVKFPTFSKNSSRSRAN